MSTILCRCKLIQVILTTTARKEIIDSHIMIRHQGQVYSTGSLVTRLASTNSSNDTKTKGDTTNQSVSSQVNDDTNELGSIYEKVLNVADGNKLPKVRLRDGSYVQTGTVGAMLANIKRYNEGQRGEVEKQLEGCIPMLIRAGLFKLFSPEEWINTTNPGRKFVGEKAQELLKNKTKTGA